MGNFKLNRVLKKYNLKREKSFLNISNVENILLLAHGRNITEIDDLITYIKTQFADKQLIIVCYIEKNIKNKFYKVDYYDKLITKRQLNFWKNPKKKEIEWINSKQCDILINLDLNSTNVLNILTAASSAKMKCGHKLSPIFDFIINTSSVENPKILLEQILFYLSTIQVKN